MRHGKRNNALGRKTAHRKAMLENMACSLIEHKRITTTVAKAKELRKFVEPIITRSKSDSTHNRREAFKNLQSKNAVSELFREVAPKVAEREGGYTRIIKLGTRMGDAAEMAMIELVDFNELMLKESKSKTRRSRRGGKKKDTSSETTAAPKEEAKADEPKAAAPAEEAKAEEPKAAEAASEAKDAPAKEETPAEDVKAKAEDAPAEKEEKKDDADESASTDEEKKD
jgi:large subunit ribosomal protein L17